MVCNSPLWNLSCVVYGARAKTRTRTIFLACHVWVGKWSLYARVRKWSYESLNPWISFTHPGPDVTSRVGCIVWASNPDATPRARFAERPRRLEGQALRPCSHTFFSQFP